MTPTNPKFRQFITQFFSDEELETLCFDYFPEALTDFGSGMGLNRKAIALIGHCERRGRLDDLRAAVARERPAAWSRQFAAPVAEKPSFFEETRFLNERDPRQIFLSHATADAEFARTLAADLRAEGWRVWIAPDSIRAGEKWVEAIDRGLETSGVFVVVLTPHAVASRWVNTETDAAVEMEHEGLITFIPLDVAACRPKRLWRQYQHAPFRGSYEVGLDSLLRRLDNAPATPVETFRRNVSTTPDRHIHEKTGIEFIRIPAGSFLYGDDKREMELPEYWIGRTPVTNAQYKRFLDANPNHPVPHVDAGWAEPYNWDQKSRACPAGKADHPVVLISWDDAQAFCDWAGLALPTEEQWEKAARGTEGRVWPWGDEPPTAEHGNFNRNVGGTTPVGKYSPQGDSPYGCVDMAGNVWEWTGSWYDDAQARRVVRGGSWYDSQNFARAAPHYGYPPLNRDNNVGCRLARRPPSPAL